MLNDIHTQRPNFEMCDQAVELGETRGEKLKREKRPPFIQKCIFKTENPLSWEFQLGAVIKMTQSVTPEVVYKVNCQSQNTFSQTVCPGPTHNQSNLNRFTIQTA